MSRRSFLMGSAGGFAVLGRPASYLQSLASRWWGPSRPPGELAGPGVRVGHLLRDGRFPLPTRHEHAGIVVIGGGIAGLTAAWKLDKLGARDFLLLELDEEAGGNARSGHNAVSAYPWGAHYVPIPPPSATAVRELFSDVGLIQGFDDAGRPFYDELALCAHPHERLLLNGTWHDGLLPRQGLADAEISAIDSFFAAIQHWKHHRGSDGKPAFTIPVDESSQDPQLLALDRISMGEWLAQRRWDSAYLKWYLNYCCRDDYGSTLDQTSAWAGLHYFAARSAQAANAPENAILTWPEGNGWLVRALSQRIGPRLRVSSLVFNVEPSASGVLVDYYDVARQESVRLSCAAAILAAPRFVAARVVRDWRERPPAYLTDFHYAPWLVANVTVDRLPQGHGALLAWDNVSFASPSLGYVVATHQEIRRYPSTGTVLTYYLPLSDTDTRAARAQALARTHEQWCDLVLADLETMHPGIARSVTRLDTWVWGHGMIRPQPGFIWGEARRQALQPLQRLWFAHSDMSGISIFEEAVTRGAIAAEQVTKALADAGT